MYKLNGEDVDVYVVIRAGISNDVILRNYTKDKVKYLGGFKSENKALRECEHIKRVLEFLGAERGE